MKLEVLISAMHLKDASIVETTRCKTDVLIINQTDNEDYYESSNSFRVRMISTCERGLANSRNMAIMNACGDICLICDDDEELVDGYDKVILRAFEQYPQADIIAFDMQNRSSKKIKHSSSVLSVRMASKRWLTASVRILLFMEPPRRSLSQNVSEYSWRNTALLLTI